MASNMAGTPGAAAPVAPPTVNLVDDFEGAFQNCLLSLSSQEHYNINDTEETKTSVDQCIQRFLDSAKQLDKFFLQKRQLLNIHKPEQVIKEDIEGLKGELMRKDQLIQKHFEKLQQWQIVLARTQGVPGTPTTSSGPTMQGMQGLPQGALPSQQGIPQASGQSQPSTPTGGPGMMQGGITGAGPYQQGPLAFLEQTTSSIGTNRR